LGNRVLSPEVANDVGIQEISWQASSQFSAAFNVGLIISIVFTVVAVITAGIVVFVAHQRSKSKDDMKWKEFFTSSKK